MYDNERKFSEMFCTKMNKHKLTVQKIESHGTGNGIPDLFIYGKGFDCFVELKNMPTQRINEKKSIIKWRPGQQAWYYEYYREHLFKKCCLTIVACFDGFLFIPNDVLYSKNIVWDAATLTIEEWHNLNIAKLIFMLTNHAQLINKDKTTREILANWVEFWYGPELDVDIDVLWNDSNTIDSKLEHYQDFTHKIVDMFKVLEIIKMNS